METSLDLVEGSLIEVCLDLKTTTVILGFGHSDFTV
jgi:hypothetical protein